MGERGGRERGTHGLLGLGAPAAAVLLVDREADEQGVGAVSARGRKRGGGASGPTPASSSKGSAKRGGYERDARVSKPVDAKPDGGPDGPAAEEADDGRVPGRAERVGREEVGDEGCCEREGEREEGEEGLEEGVWGRERRVSG